MNKQIRNKEKQRVAHSKMLAKRKRLWFEKAGPCRQCGETENLEIDHIDPATKSFTIHWGMQLSALAIELEKCQPLCNPCHLEKSRKERALDGKAREPVGTGDEPWHGTVRGYQTHKCGCRRCLTAMNDYNRVRRGLPHRKAASNEYVKRKRPRKSTNYNFDASIVVRPLVLARDVHGTNACYLRGGINREGCKCEICVSEAKKRNLRYWKTGEEKKATRPLKAASPQ